MFRVEWLQVALDELTTLWTGADATDRQGITTASHEIDQRLSNDPSNEGESRSPGCRITFVPPLAIRFQIEADGRTVTVLQIRFFRPRTR
jgi:hypothetical protein